MAAASARCVPGACTCRAIQLSKRVYLRAPHKFIGSIERWPLLETFWLLVLPPSHFPCVQGLCWALLIGVEVVRCQKSKTQKTGVIDNQVISATPSLAPLLSLRFRIGCAELWIAIQAWLPAVHGDRRDQARGGSRLRRHRRWCLCHGCRMKGLREQLRVRRVLLETMPPTVRSNALYRCLFPDRRLLRHKATPCWPRCRRTRRNREGRSSLHRRVRLRRWVRRMLQATLWAIHHRAPR